jgi:F-type H+-transporting ATPase subunit delta
MKRNSPAAARRYARALFDVAVARAQAEGVHATLRAFAAALRQSRELGATLERPALPAAAKKAIVRRVLGDGGDELAVRFLDILVDKSRMVDATGVAAAFESLWNAHRKVAKAEIVSAAALSNGDGEALHRALEQLTGTGVLMQTRIEPELVCGIVVRVGGFTYDGSVLTHLEAVRALMSGPV